jgi:putative membrane protein
MKSETIKKVVLYLLLGAGGLWHVLGVLQGTMEAGAPFAMVFLSLWLIYEYFSQGGRAAATGHGKLALGLWMFMVFSLSIAVEYLGVQSGLVFGTYTYGTTLEPTIGSVPVVIGFAWLNMILSSIAVTEYIASRFFNMSLPVKALLISLFMVVFDIIMEPAAVKLGYWSWEGGSIPIQNYLAWFVISFVFIMIAYGMKLFKKGIPVISMHAYYAQLIYFVLVNFKNG